MKNKKFAISNVCYVLLVVVFCVFLTTACGSKEVEKNNDTQEKEENTKTNFLDNDKSYFFLLDGKKYYAGDKISILEKVGYTMKDSEKNSNAPAGKYIIGAGYMINSEKVTAFRVTPYNIEKNDLTVGETVIGGFSMDDFYAKKDAKAANIEIYGKIKIGSTKSDVEKAFGPTDDITEGTNYTVYRYRSSQVFRSFTIRFDENDIVNSIEWQNLVFNR